MPTRPSPGRRAASRPNSPPSHRRSLRRSVAVALALALGAAGAAAGAVPANATVGDPFPAGPSLVFVAQGATKTTLYEAKPDASGAVVFVPEGTASSTRYNAIGFNENDHYLYAMAQPDSRRLFRLGQGGVPVDLGPVAGLPIGDYNQGAFGGGEWSSTLFVRDSAPGALLWRVDVAARTAMSLTLSTSLPNVADFTWADGFLWAYHGEGRRMYRIDPATGRTASWSLASLKIPADQHGAQWTYGNGNLGLSDNVTGRITQVHIEDPGADAPVFTVISRVAGPKSVNNDGAAYRGEPVDLGIAKSVSADPFTPGSELSWTLVVTNHGAVDASGFTVVDQLPAADVQPGTMHVSGIAAADAHGDPLAQQPSPDQCAIDAAGLLICTAGILPPGAQFRIELTGTVTSDATAPRTIRNTAVVIPNDADFDPSNNEASVESSFAPPGPAAPASFSVAKSVDASGAVQPGAVVTYTVRVTNTGATAYTEAEPASFTDDLSRVLDDASYNGDASAGASVDGGVLSWSGPVPVGGGIDIVYSVTVVDAAELGDGELENAVVAGPGGACASAGGCETRTPVVVPTSPPATPPASPPATPPASPPATMPPAPSPNPSAGHGDGILAHTGVQLGLFAGIAGLLVLSGVLLARGRQRRADG